MGDINEFAKILTLSGQFLSFKILNSLFDFQHNFFEHHDPTIEDAYQQRTVIDSEPCLLDILDTAGQVEFTAMREQYMRCGEGFIVCYSITDRHSFLECEEYRSLIIKVRAQDNVPIILVANKVDLDQGNNE